ncbi:glyoxylase-like metal-dependent hydrolase (beta-lactamase superfamily II) [Mitsuaria sp. BK045]|uniref:N-acyl homoserine lactonase family protein n=1 Tax=unclassified Roseateles TaxID=2626991 RepID=UPI00161EE0B4|nr:MULTISPECIES: N-acyl homoserine lactonase family protein [unclassified Roseateles]MBB3291723.1 glyoxylase-like metal-dependent hydrolase (beta-lactamase superfamily II) [Mitsuaria sp. BK041]MBB3360940.1 glyoxylase-like metal-dependent hydrolase (beta-lactamase superfamily II) [Mitsuaria sp. BK045]
MASRFWLALQVGALFSLSAAAQDLTLTRLDCGSGSNDPRRFSDTYAYTETTKPFTFSCYVIRHGNDVMVWDTGYLPGSVPNATNKPLADLLRQIKVEPGEVKYVGISHYHADHTGQLAGLRNATLLIGKGDWEGITATPPMSGANVKGFAEWIAEKRKVETLSADKDVFGDGSVMILRAPGHTPGHSMLLVRLKETGPVLLSGDAVHFHENYEHDGVPGFNDDRAQTLASIQRMKEIEKNLKATVIIQHDPRDIGKLPAFPNAAK